MNGASDDDGPSRRSVQAAESELGRLPDPLRQRYQGDVLAARARFNTPDADQVSLTAADLLERTGGTLRVPELLLRAAQIKIGRGDRDGAAVVLDDAMRRLSAQVPQSIASMRWSYADSVWPVFRQAALLRVDRGEIASALDVAEQGRFGESAPRGQLSRVQGTLDAATSVVRFLVGPDRVHAIVIRRDQVEPVALRETPAGLDALIKRYLLAANGAPGSSSNVLASIGAAIVDPVMSLIPEGDTIAFVPDGPLHHLAFGGVKLADGRFLIERNAIEIWTGLEAVEQRSERPDGRMVTVGVGRFGNTLPALPNAEREANEISSLYGGTALLGSSATAQSLPRVIANAGLLHLSTHAVANPEFPNLSWVALSPDPAHLQGLLFAHEIRQFDLSKLALVYLSTCDGARGRLSRSEGTASLARAFMDAGASAVIASGWRIDDEVARAVSVAFHRQYSQGVPASRALRAAQIEVMRADGPSASREFGWSSVQLYRSPRTTSRLHSQRQL